jgi:hypothetical protein
MRPSAEYAYKPDSVPRERGGHHLSGPAVTVRLVAMELVRPGRPPRERGYRAILLQVGFTRARVSADRRELLPHDFTLAVLVLRTSPPPVGRRISACRDPAVCFCGTFLRVAPTGRYPAPCPVKPGLSSSNRLPAITQRTPRAGSYHIVAGTQSPTCDMIAARQRLFIHGTELRGTCIVEERFSARPHWLWRRSRPRRRQAPQRARRMTLLRSRSG